MPVESGSAGGPLTNEEIRALARLLARFAEHELDQFELWKMHKPGHGDVFVYLGLEVLPGGTGEEAFTRIWPPLPHQMVE